MWERAEHRVAPALGFVPSRAIHRMVSDPRDSEDRPLAAQSRFPSLRQQLVLEALVALLSGLAFVAAVLRG
ncbi:MAG: hypothetical protein ACYC4R_03020 [Anaerolineae bacterium]